MRVGLFVPCYLDQFYPDVAIATVEVLERLQVEVEFPRQQTCCGQPMANTGCTEAAVPLAQRFVDIFQEFEVVVCPSGSCTAMVRYHYDELLHGTPWEAPLQQLKQRTFDFCEFLHDMQNIEHFPLPFPHRVGLHQSCHGLRELRLGWSSETMRARDDKVSKLLRRVKDLRLVELQRPDECCGFGGTFAVNEADLSVAMGRDRIEDHLAAGAEVLAAGDMSCLMHLEGILRREKKDLPVMHVAQILAGRSVPAGFTARRER
jgi:L-lactate dehydrogenase complex protein LldE